MPKTDIEKLKELEARLRAIEADPIGGGLARHWFRNPDGPEAADTISALLAALGEAREALEMCRSRFLWIVGANRHAEGQSPPTEYSVAKSGAAHCKDALATLAKLNALEGNEDGTC